jgi:hypothetical protein
VRDESQRCGFYSAGGAFKLGKCLTLTFLTREGLRKTLVGPLLIFWDQLVFRCDCPFNAKFHRGEIFNLVCTLFACNLKQVFFSNRERRDRRTNYTASRACALFRMAIFGPLNLPVCFQENFENA